jgi:hypothetical protein
MSITDPARLLPAFDDEADRLRVRREAERAQARLLLRKRVETREEYAAAGKPSFQRAGGVLQQIINAAAERSGFAVDWKTGEVKDECK